MKIIPLTQGKFTVVDDVDFERFGGMNWSYRDDGTGKGYAVRSIKLPGGRTKTFRLHREIMGNPAVQVDHRNNDRLDNRRKNLRMATQSQNRCNRSKQSNNTSGTKGVTRHSPSGKWRAQITVQGKYVSLGLFTQKTEAAKAYKKAASEYHGEFAQC